MSAAPPRLLVIDDDMDLLEVFQAAFSKEGFEVIAAEDGAKGLQALDSARPDIILLDLMMPVLNGFQFIAKLKEDSILDIPVVIMTGYWEEAHEAELRREPMVADFLRKPVKFAELAKVLRNVLAGPKP